MKTEGKGQDKHSSRETEEQKEERKNQKEREKGGLRKSSAEAGNKPRLKCVSQAEFTGEHTQRA